MKKALLILFFLSPFFSEAQGREGLLVYNVGLGSIFSGIGAVINKQPEDQLGKTFLNGFWKGAVGGYLIYESKNFLGKIPEKKEFTYAWGAKLLNAAGTSIIENGAANRKAWEQWHIHIGFNRIEIYTQEKFKLKYKIMPVSFLLTGYTVLGSKFESKRSLQTGELIFSKNEFSEKRANGYALGNIIVLKDHLIDSHYIMTHEMVHVYQYYDYNFLNAYLDKPKATWREHSKTFNKLSNIFYFDVQGVVLRPLYLLEGGKHNDYYFDNFFEYEAEFFSTKGNVPAP